MNQTTARMLRSTLWLTATAGAIAFSAGAAASTPQLSYWGYANVYGSANTQLNSPILGSMNVQFNGPNSYVTINETASATWNIPKGETILDAGYNLLTNYGQYGYGYSGDARVSGNQLKARISTSSTDTDWENPNPNSTYINATSQAYFTDQWLIAPTKTHKAGSYGAALVTIHMDGSFAQQDSYNAASAQLYASTAFTDASGVNYQSSFSIQADSNGYSRSGADWVAYDWSNSGSVSLTKKLLFQYGTPFNLSMNLWTQSSGNGQADFFNTGKISEVFLPLEAELLTGSLQSGVDGVGFGRILNATRYDDPNTLWDFGNGGGAIVPSVPETETYAMLLAGLAVMGVVARRRARA